MNQADQIRTQVSDAYAGAVQGKRSCCGTSGPAQPRRSHAQTIGYDAQETCCVPGHAAENSFGCGNPLAFAGVREGQTVLDLGSGAGLDLLLAAKRVGPTGRVIGVDMTDAMLKAAAKNIAAAGATNIELRKGIIENLPVEPASVDWVISNCVINLSPEKPRVFAEIARVLKRGGQLRVADIVATELPEWARRAAGMVSACVGGAITEAEYVRGLEAAGLSNVTVTERMQYSAEQLEAMLDGADWPAVLAGTGLSVHEATTSLAGRVWSATFHATRQ